MERTLPAGLTDIHCHGGGGYYFSDPNPENISKAIATHKNSGTVNLVASLVTDSLDNLQAQISRLIPFYERGEIAGIHLEGPYLSRRRCGAHEPELLRTPVLDGIKNLLDCGQGAIAMVTIAPELDGAIQAIDYLTKQNVIPAIGHSDGSYDDARAGIDAGASIVTHFTNAMSKLTDPQPSFASAVLADSRIDLELIVDGVHVPQEIIRQIFEVAAGRVILVSDAMSAAGCADGHYSIGRLEVDVHDSVARLRSNGALAGSTLTLKQAVDNAARFGITEEVAKSAATSNPISLLSRLKP